MSNEQPTGTPQSPEPAGGFPQPGAYTPQDRPAGSSPAPSSPAQAYPTQAYPGQAYPPQAYPGQAYPTQGYPGQAYPPQGFAAQVPPAQQNAYQIPNYAAQYAQAPQAGYPAAYPQAYPVPGAQPAKAPRSPILGIVSFAVVLLTVVVGGAALAQIMEPIANAMIAAGTTQIDEQLFAESLQAQIMTNYPLQTMALNVASPLGFAGWIAGIVATVTNRGRMWGVFTIILGVLAPIILVVIAMLALGPVFAALG